MIPSAYAKPYNLSVLMSPQTHKVGNSHNGPGVCLTPNLLTDEASSVIRVAAPLVNSHLRIWAQRACPVDLSCRLMGRNDLIRNFPALYPSCQGANAVEFVGAGAA